MSERANKTDSEFLMRIPSVVAPELRFLLDGVGTALFSIQCSYEHLIAIISQHDHKTLLQISRYERSLLFSCVWNIVDDALMAAQLLSRLSKKEVAPGIVSNGRSQKKDVICAAISKELRQYIEAFQTKYLKDIAGLRNMRDHLHQNIPRISSAKKALPIQGGLSFMLCHPKDYESEKAYIGMLTNNAITQDTCEIVMAKIPCGKFYFPVDHLYLTGINSSLGNTVILISELYRDSTSLRLALNQYLEGPTYEAIKEYAEKTGEDYQTLLASKAHSITTVIDMSFGRNK